MNRSTRLKSDLVIITTAWTEESTFELINQ